MDNIEGCLELEPNAITLGKPPLPSNRIAHIPLYSIRNHADPITG